MLHCLEDRKMKKLTLNLFLLTLVLGVFAIPVKAHAVLGTWVGCANWYCGAEGQKIEQKIGPYKSTELLDWAYDQCSTESDNELDGCVEAREDCRDALVDAVHNNCTYHESSRPTYTCTGNDYDLIMDYIHGTQAEYQYSLITASDVQGRCDAAQSAQDYDDQVQDQMMNGGYITWPTADNSDNGGSNPPPSLHSGNSNGGTNPPPSPQDLAATCGDGIVQSHELCDDGNDFEDDFCDNQCQPIHGTNGTVAGSQDPQDPQDQDDQGEDYDSDGEILGGQAFVDGTDGPSFTIPEGYEVGGAAGCSLQVAEAGNLSNLFFMIAGLLPLAVTGIRKK
jgi:cysteine-rich repeat protein